MPAIQRTDIPRQLLRHLLKRIQERNIDAGALQPFVSRLDTNPEVPPGDWFKRFPGMIVCGRGTLVRTFLTPTRSPIGKEL